MKRKKINNRMLVMITATLSILLLMGMNVSATVQYQQIKLMNASDIEQKINQVMSSPSYKKLKTQANNFMEQNYNESFRQEFYNTTLQRIIGALPDTHVPYAPLLCEILIVLAESCYLLFGHNALSDGIVISMIYVIGFCGSLLVGVKIIPTLCMLGFGIALDIVGSFLGSEDFLYDFGIFGVLILFILGFPLILLLLIIGIPIAYIAGVLLIMDDCIIELNEYFPYP